MIKVSKYFLLTLCLISLHESILYAQTEESKRQDYLDELILLQRPHPTDRPRNIAASFVRLSYQDSTWLDWVKRTGELPPDFDALPSIPFLPNPLILDEGGKNIPVKTLSQWNEKRAWIKQEVKHLFSGTFPPPPEDLKIRVLEERMENKVKIQTIELRFKNDAAKLTLEVFTPPGEGPFPVFLTQWNHRGWAQIAVRRGYIGCLYAGADSKDDTESYQEIYPDYDWTALMTRAWGAHRAVDYLYTLNSVDKSKIALTGHSRNGKQSLFAAAFDERITALISSSAGTGGEIPYRYTDDRYDNESIDFLTSIRPQWLHPRLRFFAGREHKLPIDQNSLMALMAPRPLLLSSSIREHGGSPWGIEQNHHALLKVYQFLDAQDKLGVRFRDGEHGTSARDIEAYLDFLDIQFQRKKLPWENKLYYDYSFEKWKSLSNENIDLNHFPEIPVRASILYHKGEKIKTPDEWKHKKAALKRRITWVMGDEPAGIASQNNQNLNSKDDYISKFINRPQVKNGKKVNIGPYDAIGDYLYGSLYYPLDEHGEMQTRANGKIPVVIFLHEYSHPTGIDSGWNSLFEDLLWRGIAVFAMDMIGFGTRIEEGTLFYERYPNWSKLGKMVTDTRASIDVLEKLEFIDKEKIFLSGYALGGTISLFTAALDERIAGTAVASAFTPWRDTRADKDHEGIMAYSHLHGLIPRLGFFTGNENKIPVDFPEIISSIAPRPLLVISPQLDRHANFNKVNQCMQDVASVYGLFEASKNLDFKTPHEFNRFTSSQQTDFVSWLEKECQEHEK